MKQLIAAIVTCLVWASVAQAGWLNFRKKEVATTTTTTTMTTVQEFVPWKDMSPVRKVVQKNAEYIASCMQYMEREGVVCGRYVER